ncbi:ComEC/Rec2 family competence protein [Amycolatopsis sp. NPDC004747]
MSGEVSSISVELLPARHGDCVLVSWGRGEHVHRALIDAGPAAAYDDIAASLRTRGIRSLDLLVLTHVDADHVEGTILLVNDKKLGLEIGQLWFNGAPQLAEGELAPVHGEILGAIISERGLPWNTAFGGAAVAAPATGTLPRLTMCCALSLTVVAPDRQTLRMLRNRWQQACHDAGIDVGSEEDALAALAARARLRPKDSYLGRTPAPDIAALARRRAGADTKIPNASSIVLLAEFGDRRVLLTGDSTPNVLLAGLRRLLEERGTEILPLTAFKLPHHGSANNVSKEIIRLAPAQHYLFSSNGSYFRHPDDTAVATVINYAPDGAELVFNYANPRTLQWRDGQNGDFDYRVRYPDEDGSVRLVWT